MRHPKANTSDAAFCFLCVARNGKTLEPHRGRTRGGSAGDIEEQIIAHRHHIAQQLEEVSGNGDLLHGMIDLSVLYHDAARRKRKITGDGVGTCVHAHKVGDDNALAHGIGHLLRGIQFPEGVTTNLLDPCCGCGKALRQLAQGNNCFTYGVELDEHRAEEAQTRLHRVGLGSFFHSRISREAFHLLLLNPPYLSVMAEGGSRVRHEKRFLVESIDHLTIGGLLVYIIPYYRLTADICRVLSDNFDKLSVWRFTDSEFKRFRQIAVLGLRRKRQDDPAKAEELEKLAFAPQSIPCVSKIPEDCYALPGLPLKVQTFKGEKFNEKELERQLVQSDSLRRMISARSALDGANVREMSDWSYIEDMQTTTGHYFRGVE